MVTLIKYSEHVTLKSGEECEISGDSKAIAAVGIALEAAGFKWNDQVKTWDEGFYEALG